MVYINGTNKDQKLMKDGKEYGNLVEKHRKGR